LIFGDTSLNPKYKFEDGEIQIVRSDKLSKITSDAPAKKALWGAMKQLFTN